MSFAFLIKLSAFSGTPADFACFKAVFVGRGASSAAFFLFFPPFDGYFPFLPSPLSAAILVPVPAAFGSFFVP